MESKLIEQMEKENAERLALFDMFSHTFPKLFKDVPESSFWLPTGWTELFMNFCSLFENQDINCTVGQVKEKFGELRVYLKGDYSFDTVVPVNPILKNDRNLFNVICHFEFISNFICQFCGAFEASNKKFGGRFITLCPKCAEEYETTTRITE